MKIDNIKEKLEQIIANKELSIYSIKTKREFGEKILEILLKGKKITTDVLEEVHLALFEKLEDGDLDDDYFLELSSLGAEYPLETLAEIVDHIGGYVYLETNKFKGVALLLKVEDKTMTLEYNNKGQFRKIKIEYDDVLNIRTSVKI